MKKKYYFWKYFKETNFGSDHKEYIKKEEPVLKILLRNCKMDL